MRIRWQLHGCYEKCLKHEYSSHWEGAKTGGRVRRYVQLFFAISVIPWDSNRATI